jgi:hypothetical protein
MDPIITTFTGRRINLFRFTEIDVNIRDIAHHLALTNRFNGATTVPVSVAHHSIYVSRLCDQHGEKIALQGLLHDASEAYLGDMTKWLKHSSIMKDYCLLEVEIQTAVYKSFSLPETDHHAVKTADVLMVRYEAWRTLRASLKNVVPEGEVPNYERPTPEEVKLIEPWTPWNWNDAENLFLSRYSRLVTSGIDDGTMKQMDMFVERS